MPSATLFSHVPEQALLSDGALRRALIRASLQHAFSTPAGWLVMLELETLREIAERIGPRAEADLAAQVAHVVTRLTGAPCVGYDGGGRLCFVLGGEADARRALYGLAQAIVDTPFETGGAAVQLAPAIGYVSLSLAATLNRRKGWALAALEEARRQNDLQPVCYRPPVQRERSAALLGAGLRAVYGRHRARIQIAATIVLGHVLPFLAYVALARAGFDVSAAVYLGTVFFLLCTSYLIWYEGFHAIRSVQPPDAPAEPYPAASAIIAAYLPNEAATIVETVRAFLAIDYPGPLEVIVAYNTPRDLPVEGELQAIAAYNPRLRLLRVPGSTSKAQNVNAALASVGGAFVGVFDADHHPEADSFTRAWRWLSHGYDVVQGHCVIRNGAETWVTRLVAVEFETIYAVSHPGRAKVHGFGIFGGSNGYWRTEVLRRTRMRSSMLTEDIDASLRATLAGYRIGSDPLLISRELAPLTLRSLWDQRMRWAQGWFQVSLAYTWEALRSRTLSLRQKLGVVHLLIWRELYPWVSGQIFVVLAFWIWRYGLDQIEWLIPIFLLTTLLTFSSGPGQVLFGYLLGAPEIRRHRRWFLFYVVAAMLFYSGLKNLISRVAMLKESLQEKQWKVTPRARRPELNRTGADG